MQKEERTGVPGDDSERRADLRLAGRGSLLAGVAFSVQPLSVGLLSGGGYIEDMRDPLNVDRWWWVGVIAGAEFFAVGIGVLVLVTALRRTWPRCVLSDVAGAAGLLTGYAFLALAATYLVSHSWWAMPDAALYTDDADSRGAVAAGLGFLGLVFVAGACLATVVWAAGVVRLTGRAGDVGRGTTITVGVMAGLIGLGTLAQMAIPFAALHIVVWLTLGVRLSRTRIVPPQVRRGAQSLV
jgi:hypothetical protein